jgi:hypothetical protein
MTGDRLLLELVGGRGGGAYEDFEHIDDGVNFDLQKGKDYVLSIAASKDALRVKLRGDCEPVDYNLRLREPLVGRVGMRPWRSAMQCSQFNVSTRS